LFREFQASSQPNFPFPRTSVTSSVGGTLVIVDNKELSLRTPVRERSRYGDVSPVENYRTRRLPFPRRCERA
jgi:hypothetical protein